MTSRHPAAWTKACALVAQTCGVLNDRKIEPELRDVRLAELYAEFFTAAYTQGQREGAGGRALVTAIRDAPAHRAATHKDPARLPLDQDLRALAVWVEEAALYAGLPPTPPERRWWEFEDDEAA